MNPAEAGKRPAVVIVDDEEDITTFLGLALEDAGYRVETVNDAGEALQVVRHADPDLICLDLLMPGRTGASLYREIRRDSGLADTPVLILSGLNARQELEDLLSKEGLPAPAGYLEKPVEIEPFLAAVEELLGEKT